MAFYLGYQFDRMKDSLQQLQEKMREKVDIKKVDEKKSTFIDPLDEIQRAQIEHDLAIRKLNNG